MVGPTPTEGSALTSAGCGLASARRGQHDRGEG